MHAEIISALALRGGVLDVVPRTTMMLYRADPQAVTRVAADLEASHVMEGSMRREADSVRLTVQLFDVRKQAYVWSQTYDRKLLNALTLQSDVAREVATQLAVAVAPVAPRLSAPTANPEAYDLYLRARVLQDEDAADVAIEPLNRALALDPSFGAAYAARAQSHHAMIVDNADDTEERLSRERRDVDDARRLLGSAAPLVLSLEALYMDLETQDHAEAIRRMDAAEAAGLSDSAAAWQKATLLMLDDRLDESIVLLQSLAVRDPGNIQTLMSLAAELGLAQRPIEALRVRSLTMDRFPNPVFTLLQGRLIFGFTGRTDVWRTALDQSRNRLDTTASTFRGHWDLLRFEKRYADLRHTLYSVDVPAVRTITSGGFSICCVGRRPTAVFRGWANLLNDDAAAAAVEGNAVLSFAAHEPPSRWNKWFLRTLVAEGSLQAGNKERAIAAARESLALMPRKLDALRSRYASSVAARVFAWAGDDDEAIALLEQLAVLKPGLGPAEITRDPLYFIPLAKNARYQALVARLELQMKNYDAEFRKTSAVQ
jgi:tetratricopeptide (TPR) repeat protein